MTIAFAEIVRYVPNAQMGFHALINEAGSPDDYAGFTFPVRVLRGEQAPFPTRLIAEKLSAQLPVSDIVAIGGAGHMGPLTHPDAVAHAIAAHIRLSDGSAERRAA